MNNALVIIGNQSLEKERIRALIAALMENGARMGALRWLDPGRVCDIPFSGLERERALALAERFLAGVPADIAALAQEGRRKKLLIADMDSTVITVECIDELAAACGLRERIAPITEAAMRGELSFEDSLRERVRLLENLPETALADTWQTRIRLTPGARQLVQTMRANGAHTALVSGGFTYFTEKVAAKAGFDSHRANRLEIAGGRLTGRVGEPILGREAKLAALNEFCSKLSIAPEEALAVGDGANDLAMIGAAGLGVAFHAKPAVAEAARVAIRHNDLTALLYLQGYARDEFAG